jgi:hypothetical protein
MPDSPGSGHSGMWCRGTFHVNGKTIQCTCTVYHGSDHGGGSGPCMTLVTLQGTDIGPDGPTRVWCRHSKDEHREE